MGTARCPPAGAGRWVLFLFLALLGMGLQAHDPGLSTASVRLDGRGALAVVTFARADVEVAVAIDADKNGNVSAAELADAQIGLNALAGRALSMVFDGLPAATRELRAELDAQNNVVLTAAFDTPPGRQLRLESAILGALPRGHRLFLAVKDARGQLLGECMLSATEPGLTVELPVVDAPARPSTTTQSFLGFLRLGVTHILTGLDHVAFLLAVLVTARSAVNVAKIVTSFTIAHSLTLGVATLGIVTVPSRIIEPIIAASVVFVGVENLMRRDSVDHRWLVTFGFGLIHGFGFAGALTELGVGTDGRGVALPLLSFNLGVELGQLALAAIFLPLIWRWRDHPVYVRRWAPACSLAVCLAGAWWFVARVS